MEFHLSRWQTIGIVVSLLWAIIAGIATVRIEHNTARNEGMIAFGKCLDTQARDTPRDTAFEACREKENEAKVASAVHTDRDAALVALAPIPLIWLFGYLILSTWRWARR